MGKVGRSSDHVLYISRPSAVLEREAGLLLRYIPEELVRDKSYEELRTSLSSYAWAREAEEELETISKRKARTHYRCTLSFERDVSTLTAKRMVNEWLERCFPKAKAFAFIHRHTEHLHIHLWIDARLTDGRKIHLGARDYRRIDEHWNRIYSREMGRDEREHLEKKRETREYKRARARGEERMRPRRGVRDLGERYKRICNLYVERDKRNMGAYELNEGGYSRDQPRASDCAQGAQGREPAHERGEQAYERVLRADRLAVREASLLHKEVSDLGRSKRRERVFDREW